MNTKVYCIKDEYGKGQRPAGRIRFILIFYHYNCVVNEIKLSAIAVLTNAGEQQCAVNNA